jgi:hypothetical protein
MINQLINLIDASSATINDAEKHASFDTALIKSIAGTGFFDLTKPKHLGGQEIDYEQLLHIILAVSARNGSLGWCLMILGQHNIVVQSYPEQIMHRLFTEEPLLLTTCFTPIGHAIRKPDGEHRLSGQWRYATGIKFCNWVAVDARVNDDEAPSTFLVPARHFHIHEDWDTIGMRATGSFSVSLEADESADIMHIPSDRRGFLTEKTLDQLPAVYRIPQRIMTALGTLAPVIGMLNGLAASVNSASRSASPPSHGVDLGTLSVHQALLTARGEAAQCDVLFRSLCSAVTRMTQRGEPFSAMTTHDILHQCGLLADRCRDTASKLFTLSGTQAARTGHPVARKFADIHVMASHYLLKLPILSMNAALTSINNLPGRP